MKSPSSKIERARWRLQAEQRAVAETQQSVGQKPTLEQFDYDQEQYLEALADYKLQSKLAEKEAQSRTQQVNQHEFQEVQQFKQREYEVMSEFPTISRKCMQTMSRLPTRWQKPFA